MHEKDTSTSAALIQAEETSSVDAAKDSGKKSDKHRSKKGSKKRRKSKSHSHHNREYVGLDSRERDQQLKRPLSSSSDSSDQDGEKIKKDLEEMLNTSNDNYLPAERPVKDGGPGWNVEHNVYDNTDGNTQEMLPRHEILKRYHDTRKCLNDISGRSVHKSMHWFGEGIMYFVDVTLLALLYNYVGGYVDGELCPGEVPVPCPTTGPVTLDNAMNSTAMPPEQCFGPNTKRSFCRRQPATIGAQGAAALAITLVAGIAVVESGKKVIKQHKSFTALYDHIDKAVEDMKEEHLYNKKTLAFKYATIDYVRFKFWEELALSQGYTNMKHFFRAFKSTKIAEINMQLETGLMSYFVYLTQAKNNDAEVLKTLRGSEGQAKMESFVDHYVKMYKEGIKKGYLWNTFKHVIPAEDTMYFLDSALGFNLFAKQGNFAYVEAAQLDTSKKKSKTSEHKDKKDAVTETKDATIIDLSSSLSLSDLDSKSGEENVILQSDIESQVQANYKMKHSPRAEDNYTAICIPMTFGEEGKDTKQLFDTLDLAEFFKKRLDQPNVKGMRIAQDAIITSILNQNTHYNTIWHYGALGVQAVLGSIFGFAGRITTTDDRVQWEQTLATLALALGGAASEVFKRYNKQVADYVKENKQKYANSVRNFIAAGFIKYDKENQELVLSKGMQYVQWISTTMPVMICNHFNNASIDKCNSGEIYMMVFNALSKYYKDEKHMNFEIEDHDHAARIMESLFNILKKKFGYSATNMVHCKSPFSIKLLHEISDDVMIKAIRKTYNFTSNSRDITRIVENVGTLAEEKDDFFKQFLATAVHEIRDFKRACKARLNEDQQDKIIHSMLKLWNKDHSVDDMKGKVHSICEKVTRMRKEEAEITDSVTISL